MTRKMTTHRFRLARAVLIASAPLLAFGACDDVSPLDYEPPVVDASLSDQFNEEQAAACRACINGEPGLCRSQYETCRTTGSVCGPFADCMMENDCWRQSDLTNFTYVPPCSQRCLDLIGIKSPNDIAASFAGLFLCVIDPKGCVKPCFGTGSGDAGDASAG